MLISTIITKCLSKTDGGTSFVSNNTMSNLYQRRDSKQLSTVGNGDARSNNVRNTLPTVSTKTNSGKPPMIVENIGGESNGRFQPTRETTNAVRPKTSVAFRRPLIKPRIDLPKIKPSASLSEKVNGTHDETKLSPTLVIRREMKEPSLQEARLLDRRASLNGTLTLSEMGTIRSDRDSLGSTITSELRDIFANYRQSLNRAELPEEEPDDNVKENRATLDLLDKIRRSAHSKPIGPMPISQQVRNWCKGLST